MSVPTPQEWRDLQARLDRIEKRLTETADSIPPDYGTANAARRGLMSREQAATVAANSAALLKLDPTTDTGWLAVSGYGTGWSAYPGFAPQYRKLATGLVLWRGLVQKSSAISVGEGMFLIPAGLIPAASSLVFPVATAGGYGEVRPGSDGVARVYAGGNAWLSLAGIAYRTD